MNRLCQWGMHLPGERKIFHRGHLFTRCSECDVTLLANHKGWHPVPIGKRVVWRERTPQDRLYAESPNTDRSRLRLDFVGMLKRRLPLHGSSARRPVRTDIGRSGAILNDDLRAGLLSAAR